MMSNPESDFLFMEHLEKEESTFHNLIDPGIIGAASDMQEQDYQKPVKFVLTKIEPSHGNFIKKKTFRKKNSPNNDLSNGRWTREEQEKFAQAVLFYGSDWKKIQMYVGTRCGTQVRSHAQKFLMRLKENKELLDKGLQKNLSWTKAMSFLNSTLNKEELKAALEAVELGKLDQEKEKKVVKKIKKIRIRKRSKENKAEKRENSLEKSWRLNDSNKIKRKFWKNSSKKKEKYRKKREELKITLDLRTDDREELNNSSSDSENTKEEGGSVHQIQKGFTDEYAKASFSSNYKLNSAKSLKKSKVSSSTALGDSEYDNLFPEAGIKADEETTHDFSNLNNLISESSIGLLKQKYIRGSVIRRFSLDEEVETKEKPNQSHNHFNINLENLYNLNEEDCKAYESISLKEHNLEDDYEETKEIIQY